MQGPQGCSRSQSESLSKTILVGAFMGPSLGPKAPYTLCSFFLTAEPKRSSASGTCCDASRSTFCSAPACALSCTVKSVCEMPVLPPRPVRPMRWI